MEYHPNTNIKSTSSQSLNNSCGLTRRTMLFNERTERSLVAELSQLDKSQQKVNRDLKKIHHVQDLLNTHLLSSSSTSTPSSTMERKTRASNRMDSNDSLPQLRKISMTGERQPDPHRQRTCNVTATGSETTKANHRKISGISSIGTIHESAPKEARDTSIVPIGEQSRQEQKQEPVENERSKRVRKVSQGYKTNQERREELIIKSRFNQLGSKFVGKEMFEKRQEAMNRQGLMKTSNADKLKLEIVHPCVDYGSNDIRSKLEAREETWIAGMLPVTTRTEPKIRFSSDCSMVLSPDATFWPNVLLFPKNGTAASNSNKPAKPKRRTSSMFEHSSLKHAQRRLSTCSIAPYEEEATQSRNEVALPKIPMELTLGSGRSSDNNSIGQAFIKCHEVSSRNDKHSKKERKRRFADLVDTIVKHGRVIHAWEPILDKVGDIHSTDDEFPSL
eukprot:gene3311-3796_t